MYGDASTQPELASVTSSSQVRRAQVETAISHLLWALGKDIESPGLKDTPKRVAKLYEELLFQDMPEMTFFPNENEYSQMVFVGKIPLYSFCEHHLIPFHGFAHIAYIPGKFILGLSKLPRLVRYLAGNFTTQEALTNSIASHLELVLKTQDIAVMLQAEHLCVSMRGARTPGAQTTTSYMNGAFMSQDSPRAEFYKLVELGGK